MSGSVGSQEVEAPPQSSGATAADRERFEVELEFVQCLASPEYLHFLAQQRYFDDPAFMAFLQYLTYWRQPQYAKFIQYPHCLYMLDALLTRKQFRTEMLVETFRNYVHHQQFNHWRNYRHDPLADAAAAAAKKAEVASTEHAMEL